MDWHVILPRRGRRVWYASVLAIVFLLLCSTVLLGRTFASTVYDGTWSGTTSQGKVFTFTVTNDRVTYLQTKFDLSACTVTHTFTGNLAISNNSFSGSGGSISIQGTFNSLTAASGSALFSDINPFCGGTVNVAWSATRSGTVATTTTPTVPVTVITIGDFFFAPSSVTVPPNSTIRWQNTGQLLHTVTSPGIGDVAIPPGGTFDFPFVNAPPGTYSYFCRLHPSMTGQVIIAGDAPPIPTNTPTSTATGETNDPKLARLPVVIKAEPTATPTQTPTATPIRIPTSTTPGERLSVSVSAAGEEREFLCSNSVGTFTQTPEQGYTFVVANFKVTNPNPGGLTINRADVVIVASDGTTYKAIGGGFASSDISCLGGSVTLFSPNRETSFRMVFMPRQETISQSYKLRFPNANDVTFKATPK